LWVGTDKVLYQSPWGEAPGNLTHSRLFVWTCPFSITVGVGAKAGPQQVAHRTHVWLLLAGPSSSLKKLFLDFHCISWFHTNFATWDSCFISDFLLHSCLCCLAIESCCYSIPMVLFCLLISMGKRTN
jgi:hypothetical protein